MSYCTMYSVPFCNVLLYNVLLCGKRVLMDLGLKQGVFLPGRSTLLNHLVVMPMHSGLLLEEYRQSSETFDMVPPSQI